MQDRLCNIDTIVVVAPGRKVTEIIDCFIPVNCFTCRTGLADADVRFVSACAYLTESGWSYSLHVRDITDQ